MLSVRMTDAALQVQSNLDIISTESLKRSGNHRDDLRCVFLLPFFFCLLSVLAHFLQWLYNADE
jgi:hypothetical protein